MNNLKYCEEVSCIRKIFAPHIYCDKHEDNASKPERKPKHCPHNWIPCEWEETGRNRHLNDIDRRTTVTKLYCTLCDTRKQTTN